MAYSVADLFPGADYQHLHLCSAQAECELFCLSGFSDFDFSFLRVSQSCMASGLGCFPYNSIILFSHRIYQTMAEKWCGE